jgi:hypothetical protein
MDVSVWWLFGAAAGWLFQSMFNSMRFGVWNPTAIIRNGIGIAAIIVFLAGSLLAIYSDAALLPHFMLRLKVLLLGWRFEAIAIGFAIGWLLSFFRYPLQTGLESLFDAFIGDEKRSPWALQAAIATLALVAILLAFKPDLLDHLASLKAGNVEAQFAEISSSTRESHSVNLRAFRKTYTVGQWIPFFQQNESDQSSGRAIAISWFDPIRNDVIRDRSDVTKAFAAYVIPVFVYISCAEDRGSANVARHDAELAEYIIKWQEFLVGMNSQISPDFINKFIEVAQVFRSKLMEKISERCKGDNADWLVEPADKEATEAEIWSYVVKARDTPDIYRKKPLKVETYAVTILDPYITGAIADLTLFMFGHEAKADFLSRISEKFDKGDDNFLMPGIINIYYQMADSKLTSEVSWPLDEVIEELEMAIRGGDNLISKAMEKARLNNYDKEQATLVLNQYNRNRVLFLTRMLDTYNDRVLSGETINEFHRQTWTHALSRTLALLQRREDIPFAGFDDVPAWVDDDASLKTWPSAKIDKSLLFDANIAVALSAILRANHGRRASSASCAVAASVLEQAKSDPLLRETSVANEPPSQSDLSKIRQYLATVSARVSESCP